MDAVVLSRSCMVAPPAPHAHPQRGPSDYTILGHDFTIMGSNIDATRPGARVGGVRPRSAGED